MDLNIRIFKNKEFGAIRTMKDEGGEPLFCLRDVCEVLELRTQKVVQRLEDDVLSKYPIVDSLGRTQQATFVNEDGLYDTILESRKPHAKKFRKWVTSEVLPSIRKQGGYMVVRPDESDEAIMTRALQIAHATLMRRDEEIARLKPKADYADQVLDSVSCLTTTQVAKGMGMTAMELNRILCQKGIQYGQSGQYLLYASYARKGLAQNRTRTFLDLFGTVHTTSQLVWTEKGREFIHKLLLN
ncbi:MAG: phage antirepressor KilAC domain-containing protein [Bacteroidaceae bacterium]|nr:phage antirepressor KilAC domain-containing protein [Bacteroidaceae bacterium]